MAKYTVYYLLEVNIIKGEQMPLPDNRMRFPASPIDFDKEVGITGQDHDEYPKAGTQPRFDWMRMAIISLLSQQSSYSEPVEFREGTAWFDLNDEILKIRKDDEWRPFAEVVGITEDGYTLADFHRDFKLLNLSPNVRWSGTASKTQSFITMPPAIISALHGKSDLTASVYINGKLVGPDRVSVHPGQVTLKDTSLTVNDEFVVEIRNISIPATLTQHAPLADTKVADNKLTIDMPTGRVGHVKTDDDIDEIVIKSAEPGQWLRLYVENTGSTTIAVKFATGTVSGADLPISEDLSVGGGDIEPVDIVILS